MIGLIQLESVADLPAAEHDPQHICLYDVNNVIFPKLREHIEFVAICARIVDPAHAHVAYKGTNKAVLYIR